MLSVQMSFRWISKDGVLPKTRDLFWSYLFWGSAKWHLNCMITFNHLRCHSSSTALGTRTGYWKPTQRDIPFMRFCLKNEYFFQRMYRGSPIPILHGFWDLKKNHVMRNLRKWDCYKDSNNAKIPHLRIPKPKTSKVGTALLIFA